MAGPARPAAAGGPPQEGGGRGGRSKYSGQAAHSNEHYTPAHVMAAVHRVMGRPDLDPASCAEANTVVRARRYLTAEDDGLAHPWPGRVWCNPPYSAGTIAAWVRRWIAERECGRMEEGCLLLNAVVDTRYGQAALGADAVCFPRGRLRFWGPGPRRAGAQIGQMICYAGPRPGRFAEELAPIGRTLLAPTRAGAGGG